MKETPIMFEVRRALAATGHILLWRSNTGFDRERKVKYGLGLGGPDLIGVLKPTGRLCGFEVKTPTGRLMADQKLWHDVVRGAGGFVAVVRSADDALAALERAIRGESC